MAIRLPAVVALNLCSAVTVVLFASSTAAARRSSTTVAAAILSMAVAVQTL